MLKETVYSVYCFSFKFLLYSRKYILFIICMSYLSNNLLAYGCPTTMNSFMRERDIWLYMTCTVVRFSRNRRVFHRVSMFML